MKLGLILSNDWELFGDGSGDYFEVQHKPLEDLLEVFAKYGAKLTVMAEVGQQWAHMRIADRKPWARTIVEAWESLLQETIKRKHDVQLHIHPQWLEAEYKNNKWHVNLDNWAISSLPAEATAKIFKEGKLYLESFLKPVEVAYECIAFRAGAYCIQPSKVVIRDLLNGGFVCDTSVTKGMYNRGFFDYRDAYSNVLPWFVHDGDVNYQNDTDGELLEIPIHSYKTMDFPILRLISPKLYYLISSGAWLGHRDEQWLLERRKMEFQRYPIGDRPFMTARRMTSLRWLWRKIVASAWMQLDYDVLPPKVFARRMQKIFEDKSTRQYQNEDIIVPVMASGHVKRIHNPSNIDHILDEVESRLGDKVLFWTLHEAVSYWIKNRPTQGSNTTRITHTFPAGADRCLAVFHGSR
jgi:hypothetical protein